MVLLSAPSMKGEGKEGGLGGTVAGARRNEAVAARHALSVLARSGAWVRGRAMNYMWLMHLYWC
jgi:hypothetical protein